MDYKEYMSQLGKKSASRLSAPERAIRARNAARKRWDMLSGKHDANGKHELICTCGIPQSKHDHETHGFSPV